MLSVFRTNPSWLAASPFAHVVPSLSEGTRQGLHGAVMQRLCTSLGSAVPLGGESCSPAYHCQAQLQGYFTGMVSPCLIYAACIQIVKDHPGRPFCHWNSNAFSFQPSLCFWELHAIFCDCVLPLYNPGNISQAFQWTMVLSRTVVLLLTLYC